MHHRRLAAWSMAVAALFTASCERAVFAVANRGVPAPETSVVYAPAQGLSLDVYRPTRASATPAPVVVFFYGGGWTRGMRGQYRFVGERLAREGMVAIVADYRLYPQTTFPGFVEDGARAVRWARDNAGAYGGDASRVFVMGHSAGAQIGALLATDARYLAAEGLQRQDLAGFIGLAGPYDFSMGRYAPVFGPQAQWPRAMAQNFIDGGAPSLLLVHGDADDVVYARNSQQLHASARADGVDSTLVVLAGGSHTKPLQAFYDPDRAPDVLPAVKAFVDGRSAARQAAPVAR